MRITVLSGKGGVGKSSIAASLAIALSRRHSIICADCDVDAANLALVLGLKECSVKAISTSKKASFRHCTRSSCRKCLECCYFNAIEWYGRPSLKKFSCEGCGVCEMVCPEKSVKLVPYNNATIMEGMTSYGFSVVSAQLKIGESGSGRVVTEVITRAAGYTADIMLVDSAAGIGCPVIASVAGSDYAVIVTEPTPSALADMKRAIEIVQHFRIPYGIVINKYDLNRKISARVEASKVLTRIPYDISFVSALVSLTPVINTNPRIESIFVRLAAKLGTLKGHAPA
ncbi:MAG: ATP-binding protein [archaeon]